MVEVLIDCRHPTGTDLVGQDTPRYQSRLNQPIVVGSIGGRSAAQDSTGFVAPRSSRCCDGVG